MSGRRDARPTTQDHLVTHELAVVFAQRPDRGAVAWVRDIGTSGPHPHITIKRAATSRLQTFGVEEVSLHRVCCRCCFPFLFGWQPTTGPAREGVGFVKADMADRFVRVERAFAAECKDTPF